MKPARSVDETRVHRALGDPSRLRVLDTLRAEPAPLDASGLAARVGLHANTVRSHLRVLEEARLVSSRPEVRTRPGRPRLVYEATPEGVSREQRAGYRLLAEILASVLASSDQDSAAQAEAAGTAWGRIVVDGSARTLSTADDDIETMLRLLDEFGFDPALEPAEKGATVLMQHCPFGELAESYRKIVCSVHLGLMRGALAGLGAHVDADNLEPFVRPGVCAAHLERVEATAE